MREPLIIVQARMSSTRLPGKILKPFSNSKSILEIQLELIKLALPDNQLVVATTTNTADQAIVEACRLWGIEVFKGSEHDVLGRFIACAEAHKAGRIMRVCSDNPFLNQEGLKQLLKSDTDLRVDYLSYCDAHGTPAIKTHWGLFAEVVSTAALKKAAKQTDDVFYHEHVTNYIYGNPGEFKVKLLEAPKEIVDRQDLRFTIDTQQDFKTCQEIYAAWDKQSLNSLIALMDKNDHWLESMKTGIVQFTK